MEKTRLYNLPKSKGIEHPAMQEFQTPQIVVKKAI